jgi:prolyl oligopeptidase
VLLAALLAAVPSAAFAAFSPAPPPTRAAVVTDTLHGVPIADPYRWLEDKDAPETRSWVKAQMTYTMDQLGKVAGRDRVVAALAKFTRVDARTIPSVRGKRLFFTTRKADQQQAVLAMREASDGPDVVLVDPNPLSPDHNTSVTLVNTSLDGKMLVYGIRKGGEDELELHVFDVEKKAEVAGGLPKARYFGVALDKQNKGFWYSRWAPEGSRIRYHRLADDAAKDALVYGDGLGPTEIPAAGLSETGAGS